MEIKCIKDLIMEDNEQCFTKGNKYEVLSTEVIEDKIYYVVRNDNNGLHRLSIINGKIGLSHFKSV